jgi:hypothetical protein
MPGFPRKGLFAPVREQSLIEDFMSHALGPGRGNRQTVEVRHVHLHQGSQGVVGIVNNGRGFERGVENDTEASRTAGRFWHRPPLF